MALTTPTELWAAEPDKVTSHLDWTREAGADECIDARDLERAVNRRWGRQVFSDAPDADIRLVGRAARAPSGAGWTVTVRLVARDGRDLGSRELTTEAAHCSALDDSLALAVGLMLDVSKEKLAVERTDEAPSPPARQGPSIRLPRETAAPRAPWQVSPEIAAGAALGILPDVAISASAGVMLVPPGLWPFFVRGDLWLPQKEAGGGGGSTFSLWTVEAGLCPFGWGEVLAIDVCALERAGVVRAAGFGFDENNDSADVMFDVGVEGRGTIVLVEPLRLLLRAGLEAPLLRYRFFYTAETGERRSLFRTAPFFGVAHAGLSLDL